ncbi:MAG TPA: GAP family protein [Nocardioides sp.]|uniref:GAP family protein n=1 Tax=uncultured Nocardioides sp. TaxID=198441 RepID=UPI000EDC622F|nr:GAP family protein [uncultured Nocardioides sp.]HCB02888.1 hypothetical protein [Nocardioides sp.]HRD63021.1 GAP family protein [Nocardioides sp.]HRI97004.1 GAP family protein [Nocardioides sp.]HRK46744.1 GAP family protein [Nocardioides sp.]
MNEVIGDLLPVAVGVAISPVPIIAAILMLFSAHAGGASLAFLVGWVVGLTVVVVAVTLLVDPVDDSTSASPSTASSVLKIVLGAAAILLGVAQWRKRPREGETAALPGWMAAVDTVGPGKALGLGVLLSGVNPKNLTLCLSAGVMIGGGALSTSATAVAIAAFVVLGSVTVAGPVVAYLVAPERMRGPLDELRGWLTAHNAVVMTVLLVVIGTTILGKGVAGL